jgi:hypothetical protein
MEMVNCYCEEHQILYRLPPDLPVEPLDHPTA